MSEVLSPVKAACSEALDAARELSAQLPGSKTTQALVVGVVVGTATYFLLKKRYHLPPGPFALPLVGNALALSSKTEPFYAILKRWADEKYGPVVLIYMGPLKCVTLNRLDVVNEAFVEKAADFAGRPHLHSLDIMTEGFKDILFASDSDAWKLHRKIATQALRHYMRGQHLEKVIHHVLGIAMDRMLAEPEPFDPQKYMNTVMFHIIYTICFGEVKDFDDPTIQRLIHVFDVINTSIGNGFWDDVVPLLRYFPTKRLRDFRDHYHEFFNHIYPVIDEHRRTFSEHKIRDIVDSVLLAQKEAEREESTEVMAMFTDTHVGETISDIFGGGVDTSRGTLAWCLLYMAGYPEVQALVQAEIDGVTGPRMPSGSDRSKLVYTEATLYEIMRLATFAPMALPHQTTCDTSVGGYEIPEGTMVFANLYALHHDEKQWKNPNEFNPRRFIDEAGRLKTKPPGWLPFSAGRRACLGESVAKPELLLIFACMMKRCKVSLPPGAVLDTSPLMETFILHSPKPFKIILTKR